MARTSSRKSGFRKPKKNILITCEGETEKLYLNKLKSFYRIATLSIEVQSVRGGSPLSLFEFTQKKVNYNKRDPNKRYEEVFCVFDNDNKDINTELCPALKGMKEEGYIALYTNISFEFWLYLHHEEARIKAFHTPEAICTALKKIDEGYHKTQFDTSKYINDYALANALKKAKGIKYSDKEVNTIRDLESNPYTNMPILINRLKES